MIVKEFFECNECHGLVGSDIMPCGYCGGEVIKQEWILVDSYNKLEKEFERLSGELVKEQVIVRELKRKLVEFSLFKENLRKAFSEISPEHYCAEILILKDKLGILYTEYEKRNNVLVGEATNKEEVK